MRRSGSSSTSSYLQSFEASTRAAACVYPWASPETVPHYQSLLGCRAQPAQPPAPPSACQTLSCGPAAGPWPFPGLQCLHALGPPKCLPLPQNINVPRVLLTLLYLSLNLPGPSPLHLPAASSQSPASALLILFYTIHPPTPNYLWGRECKLNRSCSNKGDSACSLSLASLRMPAPRAAGREWDGVLWPSLMGSEVCPRPLAPHYTQSPKSS